MNFYTSKRISNKSVYILFAVIAVITGLLCLGTSPFIHSMGTDSEVFYMMGKGMINGKVAYRDLFDHKGLYIYFFNAIGAAIDKILGLEIGVCLIEIVFIFINLVCVYKICEEMNLKQGLGVICALSFSMISQNYFTAQGGNLVETYAVTFQLIALLYIYRILKKDVTNRIFRYMLIQGICSGICLFLRANLVMMWIPFGLYLFIKLIREKKGKALLDAAIGLISGVALSALPVLLYGLLHGCLAEMFFAMFTFNMQYMETGASGVDSGYFISIIKSPIVVLLALNGIGIVYVLTQKQCSIGVRLMYAGMVLLSAISILCTGMIRGHYYQYLVPFCIPVLIMVIVWCKKWILMFWSKACFRYVGIAVIMIATLVCNIRLLIRTVLYDRSDTYKFENVAENCAELIKESGVENPSLLATGNVVGFYHASGIIPANRFFYIPSIPYKTWADPINEQTASIISGEPDFVIIEYYGEASDGMIFQIEEIDRQLKEALCRYQLLYESDLVRDRQYCLYQRK